MTPAQQQKRRRELYKLSQADLERMLAKLNGHLLSEVRRDTRSLSDPMRYLVDLIIRWEGLR